MISPFVGRILDWYKAHNKEEDYSGERDPGVQSVQKIFNYYKQHGYKTIVMGASFRNVDEIKNLAGCDYLTIAPKLLEELRTSTDPVPKKLEAESAGRDKIEKVSYVDDEQKFEKALREEKMAHDKLHEGIKGFEAAGKELKEMLKVKLA